MIFFDDQADQVQVSVQPIHVPHHFVRTGRQHLASAQRQPHRVALTFALLQPEWAALVLALTQCQAQLAVAEAGRLKLLSPQQQLGIALTEPVAAQAEGQLVG